MTKGNIQTFIKKLNRPVFSTHEIARCSGRSLSATTQALKYLERNGVVTKIYRGIWADANNPNVSPYSAIPLLLPKQRAYVSFISALHLHHMVEQIPQVITVASTAHTRTIRTRFGVFAIHKIAPSFFRGFGWYRGMRGFLIAEPEKALVDCLYLSAYKKKQFGYFPEIHFPKGFSINKAKRWAGAISSVKARRHVQKKLGVITNP